MLKMFSPYKCEQVLWNNFACILVISDILILQLFRITFTISFLVKKKTLSNYYVKKEYINKTGKLFKITLNSNGVIAGGFYCQH